MVKLVRHPQTKGRETDRLHLSHRATSRLYPFVTQVAASAMLIGLLTLWVLAVAPAHGFVSLRGISLSRVCQCQHRAFDGFWQRRPRGDDSGQIGVLCTVLRDDCTGFCSARTIGILQLVVRQRGCVNRFESSLAHFMCRRIRGTRCDPRDNGGFSCAAGPACLSLQAKTAVRSTRFRNTSSKRASVPQAESSSGIS